MKKFLACLAALALLCTLAGCSNIEKPAQVTTVSTTLEITSESATETTTAPPTTKELISFPQTEPPAEGYSFGSYYAVTPEHFYFIELRFIGTREDGNLWGHHLWRTPWNDITKKTEIPLPKDSDGLVGSPGICGITSKWLFVSMERGELRDNKLYRISRETGKTEFMSDCYGLPWYNAGSDSLLMLQCNNDSEHKCGIQDRCTYHLEALNVATGELSVLYDGKSIDPIGYSDNWLTLDDGTISLTGSKKHIRIDAANRVREEPDPDHGRMYTSTQAECYGLLYSVEAKEDDVKNLYRMKLDGTGKKLLRAKTNVEQLLEVNGKLYALAKYLQPQTDPSNYDVMLHELDIDGKPLWNKACGTDGYNRPVLKP